VDPSPLDQILANLCVNARDAIADVGKVTIETGHGVFDADYCALHSGFVPGQYVRLAVSDDGCGAVQLSAPQAAVHVGIHGQRHRPPRRAR
jgi:signal transduction histidine kinase